MDMTLNGWIKVEDNNISCEESQPPILKPTSKALSDGSHEETPSPTYKHRWTVEQRLTLAMLAEFYNNPWDELTPVFNNFHKPDLRRCGGLRKAVVVAQWSDIKRWFDVAETLQQLQTTLSPYDRVKLASRPGLEKKARDIGIQLNGKGPTDGSIRSKMPDKHDASGSKRKRGDSIDGIDYRSDNESQRAAQQQPVHGLTLLPKTPTKSKGKQQDNGLLTPPDSRRRKIECLTADKRLAQIGFRAFTAQSQGKYCPVLGIRAGAFLNHSTVPLARDLKDTSYHQEALHHVTKHDHSRSSMFVSATKNPMRAFHMALRGGVDSSIAVIDLNRADETGNVNKAHDLKLRTEFRYTGAGEYLIFGGVEQEAIISHISVSTLLDNMPATPNSKDPFQFKVLQAHEKLSYARHAIKKEAHPMTYSLGRAVGELVGILRIPRKQFESGVWSLIQDYKFYNAEGGRKRGHWSQNQAFKEGAVRGYQAITQSSPMAIVEIEDNIIAAKTIIEIDSGSDSDSSDEDCPVPMEVEDWVRNTKASGASLQYFDLGTNRWKNQGEELSDDFFAELKAIASNANANSYEMDGDEMNEDGLGMPDIYRQDDTGNLPSDGPETDTNAMTESGLAVRSRDSPKEFENLHELCADVLHMHGDKVSNSELAANEMEEMEIEYQFSWTGM